MGGMFVEQSGGKLVRGRKRDAEGVSVYDGESWKKALSGWQEKELLGRLLKKRKVSTALAELADVEDPGVLERLESHGGVIAEAVQQHKQRVVKRTKRTFSA